MSDAFARNYFGRVYPERDTQQGQKNRETLLDTLLDGMYTSPGSAVAGRTLWGAFNSVTHYVDHVRVNKDADKHHKSIAFGNTANLKQEALQIAESLA